MNQIYVIKPYRTEFGLWCFDDPAVGLLSEPFVTDMSEIIDRLTEQLPDAANGFIALFSAGPFKGAHVVFTLVGDSDMGGATYRCEQTQTEGWLCPALFRYFDAPPSRIYAQFLPRGRNSTAQPKTKTHEK